MRISQFTAYFYFYLQLLLQLTSLFKNGVLWLFHILHLGIALFVNVCNLVSSFNSNESFRFLTKRFCVCLKSTTLCDRLFSPSSSSPQLFWNIAKVGAKKYFVDHQATNTIQLFVALQEIFLVHSFSKQVAGKGNFADTA